MTSGRLGASVTGRGIWVVLFAALMLYVAGRMGLFALTAEVVTPDGAVWLPNTFASVDHPFHVARAESLWRELASGRGLRWIGQHQGGYPVEFYPLGEAWLEVAVRAFSLGSLAAQGAHTAAVILLFLLPGLAYLELARIDRFSPAVALLALTLHVSLPGGWYHGGYTELVQWGLVTNVAGAVAALLMLPPLIRYLNLGEPRAAAGAAALAALAVYSNPRSLIGLVALGIGAWLVAAWRDGASNMVAVSRRLLLIALASALLAAPELISLLRFRDLYQFVRYSGYDTLADYATETIGALSLPILALGIAGTAVALTMRSRLASRSAAVTLIIYVVITIGLAFVPSLGNVAAQLEPTRLMPLQRLLTLYLAAGAIWLALTWITARLVPRDLWAAPAVAAAMAATVLIFQTTPRTGPAPDPASPAIPARSLYPVAMSARLEQIDLETAIRAVDEAAAPGTAILVLGSALSWHQQLWAPLWTKRPLYYDNWLWYWHPYRAGTPGYLPDAGHHYPDPERTLDREYLERHGIGAVVVTGEVQEVALRSSLLRSLRDGLYAAYLVNEPVTTITFGASNSESQSVDNQRLAARSAQPATSVIARVNWYPRWAAKIDGRSAELTRRSDGYMETEAGTPASDVQFVYVVQRIDWLARVLAAIGVVLCVWLLIASRFARKPGSRWYLEYLTAPAGASRGIGVTEERFEDHTALRGGR